MDDGIMEILAFRNHGIGCQVSNLDQLALIVEESDAQGDKRILHPEAPRLFLPVDKEHAFIVAQCLAIHQTTRVLG